MKIAIRTDASVPVGTGHVMRCLTMAEALRKRRAEVVFVCREEPGNCCKLVMEKGFQVFGLPVEKPMDSLQDAEQTVKVLACKLDWLIADHYGIGAEWERCMRCTAGGIMVIDDLADRPHECDLLLDQNLYGDMWHRYDALVPAACRLFLGPRHALLREEFITARRTLRRRDGVVGRILVFFGGSDPTNETAKALAAIKLLQRPELHVDVVIGDSNPHRMAIEELCATMPNVSWHRQVSTMAALMTAADLSVGAGGITTWERCFLGLPSLVVVVAGNQEQLARAADHVGIIRLVGNSAAVTVDSLAKAMCRVLDRPGELATMANRSLSLMGERSSPVSEEIMTCLYGEHHES